MDERDAEHVTLYTGYCPVADSPQEVNLVWRDFKTFDFNVFKIDQSKQLTVQCTVDVFRNTSKELDDCNRVTDSPLNNLIISRLITIASATHLHINYFIFVIVLFVPLY